jgi:[ribosomal protein S5]-alanine N-acetyltransferase
VDENLDRRPTSSVWVAPPSAADEAEFLHAVRRSKALHGDWVAPPTTSLQYARYLDRFESATHAGFLIRTDDRLVGVANINEIVMGSLCSGYLGYYAFSGAEGRGLMTEGVRRVVTVAFTELRLHRVEANIQPANHRSARLVERLGFVHEGFSERYLRIAGEWRDHDRWAITAEHFSGSTGTDRRI